MGRRALRTAQRAAIQRRRDVSWKAGLWSERTWRRLRRRWRSGELWRRLRPRRRARRKHRLPRAAAVVLGMLAVIGVLAIVMTTRRIVQVTEERQTATLLHPRAWVASAEQGDPAAPALLAQSLAEFRSLLPRTARALGNARAPLPDHPLSAPAECFEDESALQAAQAVACGEACRDAVAPPDAAGHAAVLNAILLLEQQNLLEREGLLRAARLHGYLQRTLRFDGIQLTAKLAGKRHDPSLPLNQRAGQLWRWFVHDYAPDLDTYRLYCETVR
jgi:hypothetical protein